MTTTLERAIELLEAQVASAEASHTGWVRDFLVLETRRHQTFYVADAQGMIQLHQDAPFVAEAVYRHALVASNALGALPDAWMSLEDASSSRVYTDGNTPAPGASLATVPVQLPFVDVTVTPPTVDALDGWFVLPVEQVFPRGGTIRVRWLPDAGTAAIVRTVILGGYKLLAR